MVVVEVCMVDVEVCMVILKVCIVVVEVCMVVMELCMVVMGGVYGGRRGVNGDHGGSKFCLNTFIIAFKLMNFLDQ